MCYNNAKSKGGHWIITNFSVINLALNEQLIKTNKVSTFSIFIEVSGWPCSEPGISSSIVSKICFLLMLDLCEF